MAARPDPPAAIRFDYQGGGRGPRRRPFRIAWRQLPYALLESPEGGTWRLELEDRPPATVRSGEVMVIPRGVRHALTVGPRPMHSSWAFVCFDGLAGTDLLAAARIPRVVPRPTGRQLVAFMAELRELEPAVSRGNLAALARCQAVGFRMLELMLRHAEVRELAPPDPEIERLLPALHYAEANLGRPLSAAALARQAYLSPSRFHRVFRRALGRSPMAYVREARLRLARHLLLTTDLPVAAVAERAGFASPYYFSRAFRRHADASPTGFRRNLSSYRTAGPARRD